MNEFQFSFKYSEWFSDIPLRGRSVQIVKAHCAMYLSPNVFLDQGTMMACRNNGLKGLFYFSP